MKQTAEFIRKGMLATLVAMMGLLCALPYSLKAQSPGNNAVWNSGSTLTGSQAYIDASVLDVGGDICGQILAAYAVIPSTASGAIIDARGILPSGLHGSQSCTTNNPFASFTGPAATVLLPASTILLNASWTLPSNVRLVGDGPNTVIRDNAGVGTIIQMGTYSLCPSTGCLGVSVENLTIDGNASEQYNSNGIVDIAQDGSYVSNVRLENIGATSVTQTALTTGLTIAGSNSGPYSDIYFTASQQCQEERTNAKCPTGTGSYCTCPATACIQIQEQSRGLHGITCSATSVPYVSGTTAYPLPKAAIYLDASSNFIEDVHVEGFYDGVVVGDSPSSSPSAANTISNINGVFGQTSGPVYNTIHICNSANPYSGSLSACTQNTSDPVSVSDVTIDGASSIGGTGFSATTVQDDLTSTQVNFSVVPASVALYSVGEPVGVGGASAQYSRFTTAPVVPIPNWGIGKTTLAADTVACSTPGALYSNTQGVNTHGTYNSIYVCAGGYWKPIA